MVQLRTNPAEDFALKTLPYYQTTLYCTNRVHRDTKKSLVQIVSILVAQVSDNWANSRLVVFMGITYFVWSDDKVIPDMIM